MVRSVLPLIALLAFPLSAFADAFDNYTNPILATVPKAAGAKRITELTAAQLTDAMGVLPGLDSALVVVKTNEGRWSKLLVVAGQQRIPGQAPVPILLIERFVTFQEGEERAVAAESKNLRLFADFRFNLDLGQVVPANVPSDLHFLVKDGKILLSPVGKAELYLVTKHLPEAQAKKLGKLKVGPTFEPKYFNGVFKLYDDGRRSGTLHLTVEEDQRITGWYFSDKDGKKYDVSGKIGSPTHLISFKITFPRSFQTFQGWIFTGDGLAITGVSRLQDRETGFYAVRLEEK